MLAIILKNTKHTVIKLQLEENHQTQGHVS